MDSWIDEQEEKYMKGLKETLKEEEKKGKWERENRVIKR